MSNSEQLRQALERIANYPLRDGAAHCAEVVPLTHEQRIALWHACNQDLNAYTHAIEAHHNITAPSAGKEGE